jgi:hypothetical protein
MSRASVLDQVEAIDSIRAVLDWASAQSPPAEVIDAIAQDEATHDILVRVGPSEFLAFDVSCLGRVRAVAYWDYAPTPDDLLAHRVSQGWKPTPTHTKSGDVILGYAAILESAVA